MGIRQTAALGQRSVKFAGSHMAHASFPLLQIRMQDLLCRKFRFKFSDPRPSLCLCLCLSSVVASSAQTVETGFLRQFNKKEFSILGLGSGSFPDEMVF